MSGQPGQCITLIPSVTLDCGETVSGIPIVYETWGWDPSGKKPVVLLIHALTGSSHARSTPEDSTPGWWEPFIGAGLALDPEKVAIISPNLPGSSYGSWVPDVKSEIRLTIADMARILEELCLTLGIASLKAVVGGSLGGMVAHQIVADQRIPIEKTVLLSCGAKQSAWAKAWGHLGLTAMENAINPLVGLSLARQIAMLSYRTPFDFGSKDEEGRSVQHYLYYQGTKFLNRFNNWSYELLVRAMDTHHVSQKVSTTRALIVGNLQDLLYPIADQKAQAELFDHVTYFEFDSDKGHDAFLVDHDILNPVIHSFLAD
ncbi:MAG: alpha/beta fold hydrolase [Bacteroidetes bacterium]|nr:alpha/beta fold hydrolase [Bacteroidota bacterium]